ncbi:MAG: hypothetical protein ACO3XJ_00095 [Candidatus Nanopelagicales bacterium]
MPNQIQALVSKFEDIKVHWFDVAAVIAVSAIIAFIRVRDQLPQLYPDEFLYVSAIRGDNAGDLPNYFYTLLYKPTAMCGEAFYTCMKGMNVLLFTLLLVLTFLIARKLVLLPYALLFVAFMGLGPLSGFTTLATPEMLFFVLSFAVIALFQYFKTETWLFWSGQALLNALLLLTKPHGVFVTLGLVGFLIFQGVHTKRILVNLARSLGFVFVTYTLVIAIRFILSGNLAFNPLGTRYSGALAQSGETLTGGSTTLDSSYFHPFNLIWAFLQQLASHASVGLALVGVGFLVYMVQTFGKNDINVDTVFVFIFGSLLAGTAVFSTLAVFWGELLQIRLMPRYYEHLLLLAPLFFLRKSEPKTKLVYLLIGVIITLILMLIQGKYIILPFDSYFLGIWVGLDLPLVLLALPSLVIGLLLLKNIELAKVATIGGLFLMLIVFNANFQIVTGSFKNPPQVVLDTYELRDYLHTNSKNTIFVAADPNEYNRVKFWLPEDTTAFVNNPSVTAAELDAYKTEYDIVVVLNSAELEAGIEVTFQNESFNVIETS